MTAELDERLRRSDPLGPDWSPEPSDGPRARTLLEQIMSTPVIEPTERPERTRRTRRRWWAAAAAVAVAAVATGGVLLANRDRDTQESGPPLEFQLPGGDASMQMCLPVTDHIPDPSAQAFGGTVTAVEPGRVTVEVDRWYTEAAEQADVVELTAGTDVSVALDGVEFVAGQRYLVSVLAGEVQICGISGPATPELEALYEQWYGS